MNVCECNGKNIHEVKDENVPFNDVQRFKFWFDKY